MELVSQYDFFHSQAQMEKTCSSHHQPVIYGGSRATGLEGNPW